MAALEAQPYQTRQDDQEGPLRAWFGELPIFIRPSLLRAFLLAQVPLMTQAASDPKAKTLRFALKAVARLAMDIMVLPHARRGEVPMPDMAAMKADILGYSIVYWSDLMLYSLASTPWELLYVEQADGSIEITGVAPAGDTAAVLAGDASVIDSDELREAGDPTGELAGRGAVGTVVLGGNDGEWQDDVRQKVDAGDAASLA
jgi:hypothetical protein